MGGARSSGTSPDVSGGVNDERYRERLLAWPVRHIRLCAGHIDDRTGFEGLHKMENRPGFQETEKSL